MRTYPNLKNDTDLLKMKTKDHHLKELQYKAGKHDHQNILKSLKIAIDYYKKKYRSS